MKNYTLFIIFTSFCVLCVSCSSNSVNPNSVHKLSLQTYVNDIYVEGTVEAVNSVSVNGPQRMNANIIYLVEEGTAVEEGDTVCIVEEKQIENYYETMLANIENTKATYTKTEAELELKYAFLKSQLENIEAQTAIANLDSSQIKYLSPVQQKIKKLELKKSEIQHHKVQKEFEYLKPINDSELRKIKLQIKQDSLRSLTYKDMLDDMILTSPIKGIALRGRSPNSYDAKVQEGDMTYPGYPIINIPDLTEVRVLIMASESAFKRISVNDKVAYTFDGMAGNIAWGKIELIEPMGQPVSRNSKVKEFKVYASIDSFKVIPNPGLSANCRIVLDEVHDTIVVPQLAIFEEDSVKVVYVLESHTYSRKEVLLGESSPKEAVVISGLRGDETLALNKPTQSRIKHNIPLADSIKLKMNKPKPNNKLNLIDSIAQGNKPNNINY